MNKVVFHVAAVLSTLATTGFVSAVQTGSGDAPNYQLSHPNYQYAITVSSLRDIDFKNFKGLTSFRLHDGKPDEKVNLVNGKFSQRYPEGGGEQVDLELVRLIDGGNRAVIGLLWNNCGGSCADGGLVQVFELQGEHPTVVEQIIYERHAPETGALLPTGSRMLTITGRSAEASPNCCPKSLDVMNFEWDGSDFAFKSRNRVALPDTP
jgi:hypothetical protein